MSRLLIALLLYVVLLPGPVYAQRNNANSRDERRENQRVQAAEKEVGEAKKKLAEAQKQVKSRIKVLDQSHMQVVGARRQYREAEELVEDLFGNTLGIPGAMAKVKEFRKELDRLSEPVLAKLHESEEWKSASLKVEQIRKQRDALLENAEIDETARASKLEEFSRLLSMPSKMEEEAIENAPDCRPVSEQLKTALAELELLRKKISRDQVDSHPKVREAAKKIDQLMAENQRLEKDLVAARISANKAFKNLQSAMQKLQKAKSDDAKDANRPNKK
jgi:DNA repair exonuclease SbcCD ATPase subunit